MTVTLVTHGIFMENRQTSPKIGTPQNSELWSFALSNLSNFQIEKIYENFKDTQIMRGV